MPISADSLIITLILIIPGFISVNFAVFLFGTSRYFSEFEKSSWSLSLSFIIDALFLRHHQLDNIEKINDFGMASFLQLEHITELFLISIIIGVLCAFFLRIGILNIFHKTIWLFSERKNYIQFPWEISLSKADWIIVISDKIEYFGWLAAYSTHEQKKEIVLGDPEIIIRDENGEKKSTNSCGKQLIIPEGKIDQVIIVSFKETLWEQFKSRIHNHYLKLTKREAILMDKELKEYLKNLKDGKIITSSEYRDKYGEVNQEVRTRAINAHYIEYGSSGPDTIEITDLGLEQLGVLGWIKNNYQILKILLALIAIIVTIVVSYFEFFHN